MTEAEARAFTAGRDQATRVLTREPKCRLAGHATRAGIWASADWSKDELVASILGRRYPVGRLNEAIHVLHHRDGVTSSACGWCAPDPAGAP